MNFRHVGHIMSALRQFRHWCLNTRPKLNTDLYALGVAVTGGITAVSCGAAGATEQLYHDRDLQYVRTGDVVARGVVNCLFPGVPVGMIITR
jgi:hypothetical protein